MENSNNQSKIEKWIKFRESTNDNIKYAEGRFDILIISLSSGGLVLLLNYYKSLIDLHICLCGTISVLWPISSFISAILSNLISQLVSAKSNRLIAKYADEKIKQYEGSIAIADVKIKRRSDYFDNWNSRLNIFSLASLLVGILLFIIFAWNKL